MEVAGAIAEERTAALLAAGTAVAMGEEAARAAETAAPTAAVC